MDVEANNRQQHRRATRIVLLATITFCVFSGVTNYLRQVNLVTSQFDMGNMDQVLWHSLHGQWFQMSSPLSGVLESRTATHADFLLLAYLPFYAVFPVPQTPLVLQVLAVASGALPLFWLARKRLRPTVAAFFAVLYLLYPTLEWATFFDVHAVVLAMPLVLWAWWAAVERRWFLFYPLIVLVALSKEEAGLAIAAMGVYWVWRRSYRTMGIVSILFGIGWSVLMVAWAIPSARHVPGHFALQYYDAFGGSYTAILKDLLLHPLAGLSKILDGRGILLLLALLLPVGGVALLGLPVLLCAVPELAINLLSSYENQQTIFFQYMSLITPFVFLAAIDGWARADRWLSAKTRNSPASRIERRTKTSIVAVALASVWVLSPLPGTLHTKDILQVYRPSPYRNDVQLVQRSLKPSDRVVATNNLVPQFSRRDLIWGFPNDLAHADAIVVLEGGEKDLRPMDQINAMVAQLTKDPTFVLVYHRDLFWYFRRAAAP